MISLVGSFPLQKKNQSEARSAVMLLKMCCKVVARSAGSCCNSFTKQMKPAIRLPQTYCNLGVKHLDVLREK